MSFVVAPAIVSLIALLHRGSRQGAGGFGAALGLLSDLASEVWDRIGLGVDAVVASEAHEAELLGGLWYVNIHSTFRPGGEIRGQIARPDDRDPAHMIKLGYDKQFNDDLRVRVTGSWRSQKSAVQLPARPCAMLILSSTTKRPCRNVFASK